MGTVVVFGDEGKAAIFADGIQQPAAGRTYQMWVIHDDIPESLGTMKPDADGHVSRVIAIDGARGDSFALTVEPEGGSAQPTSAPVLVADL
jgi:anti-sigma-K factor RskA